MKQLIIYRGLPGSGKSTHARGMQEALNKNGENAVIIERDMIRDELGRPAVYGDQDFEHQVTVLQEQRIRAALKADTTVLVSDTNLPDRSVKRFLEIAHQEGAEPAQFDMRVVSLEVCLVQNAKRPEERRVPEDVIRDKHKRFVQGKDLTKLVEYTPKPALPKFKEYEQGALGTAFIFDVDGTLAVMGDRSPYDGDKVHLDTLNEGVAETMRALMFESHRIIVVSGRDEKYRAVTEKWFIDNRVLPHEFYMRPAGDNRNDAIVKDELFEKHIAGRGLHVLGVFDDRHRVLRMWREKGLLTFHINGPDAGQF